VLTNDQQQSILSKISTSRILAVAAELEALDRLLGGRELEQACERVAALLREAGAHQVGLTSFPCGADHRSYDWWQERRPFTEEAELWLVGPDESETLICRSSDNPACSMGAFRSTPPEGEVLEVVDVGFGTRPSDYRGHRLAGKLALASGHHFQAAMMEALAQRQAEGLLCGPGSEVAVPGHVVPNRLGDPSLFTPRRPMGFNLGAHQFNRLGNLLATGATVHARVRTRVTMDTGDLPAVTAALEGSELADEQVLLLADLSHTESPLGVACLQEILRTYSGLVVQGVLAPPRRSLHLVLGQGQQGVVAWLHERRDALSKIRAAMHLSLAAPEAATLVHVEPTLPARPTFLADLVHDNLRWAATARGAFRGDVPMEVKAERRASRGAVAVFADRSIAIPAVGLRGTDRPRLPDGPRSTVVTHGPLHRLTAALCSAVADLCSLRSDDLPRLICSSHLWGHRRLGRRSERLHDHIQHRLHHEEPDTRTGRHLLWLVETGLDEGLRRESEVVRSCAAFVDGRGQLDLGLAETDAQLRLAQGALKRSLTLKIAGAFGPRARMTVKRRPASALERRASAIVPRRRYEGPLPTPYLLREAAEADRLWLAHNAGLLEQQPVGEALMVWIDGERNLLEIYDRVCLDDPGADLKLLWRYLEALQSAGLLELGELSSTSTVDEAETEA
jgi:hypothetical protein